MTKLNKKLFHFYLPDFRNGIVFLGMNMNKHENRLLTLTDKSKSKLRTSLYNTMLIPDWSVTLRVNNLRF